MRSISFVGATTVICILLLSFVGFLVFQIVDAIQKDSDDQERVRYSFTLCGLYCLLTIFTLLLGHFTGERAMERWFPAHRIETTLSLASIATLVTMGLAIAATIAGFFSGASGVIIFQSIAFSLCALSVSSFAYVAEVDRAALKVGKKLQHNDRRSSVRASRRKEEDDASELVRLSLKNMHGEFSYKRAGSKKFSKSFARQSFLAPSVELGTHQELVFPDIVEVDVNNQNHEDQEHVPRQRSSFRNTILRKILRRSTKKVNHTLDVVPDEEAPPENEFTRVLSHYTSNNGLSQVDGEEFDSGGFNFSADVRFSELSFSMFLFCGAFLSLLLIACNLFGENDVDAVENFAKENYHLPLNLVATTLIIFVFLGIYAIHSFAIFQDGEDGEENETKTVLSLVTFAHTGNPFNSLQNDYEQDSQQQTRTDQTSMSNTDIAEIWLLSFLALALFLIGPLSLILESSTREENYIQMSPNNPLISGRSTNEPEVWRVQSVIASLFLLLFSLIIETRAVLAYWRLRLSDTLNKTLSLQRKTKQKKLDNLYVFKSQEQAAWFLTFLGSFLFPLIIFGVSFINEEGVIRGIKDICLIAAWPAAFVAFEVFYNLLDLICCLDPAAILNNSARKFLPLWIVAVYSLYIVGDESLFSFASPKVRLALAICALFLGLPLQIRVYIGSSPLEKAFLVPRKPDKLDIRSILSQNDTREVEGMDLANEGYDELIELFNVPAIESLKRRKTCLLFRPPIEDIYITNVNMLSHAQSDGNFFVGIRDMLGKNDDERFLISLFNLVNIFKEDLNTVAADCILEEVNQNRYIYLRSLLNKFLFVTMFAIHSEGKKNYKDSAKLFAESVDICQELHTTGVLLMPTLELRQSLACLKFGDPLQALELVQSCCDLKSQHMSAENLELGESHIFLAHTLSLTGQAGESFKSIIQHQTAKIAAISGRSTISEEEASVQFELWYQVFETMMQVSSKDISIAIAVYNISLLLLSQGEINKATALLQIAIDVAIASVGYYHFLVSDMLDTVSDIHFFQEDFEEALVFQKEALRIVQSLYGSNNVIVAVLLHKTGERLERTLDLKDSMQCFDTALAMKKAIFTNQHPSVSYSLLKKAEVLTKLGRETQATKVYREALRIQRKIYGKQSRLVVDTMKALGKVYRVMGNFMAAIDILIDTLTIEEVLSHESSLECSLLYFELGCVFADQGDYDSAFLNLRMAQQIQEEVVALDAEELADTNHMIVEVEKYRERILKEEEAEEKPVKKTMFDDDSDDEEDFEFDFVNSLGPTTKDSELEVVEALDNLGLFHYQRKNYQEAMNCFAEALKMLVDQRNRSQATLRVTKHLVQVFLTLNEKEKALALLQDCVNLERKLYGNSSREAQDTSQKIEEILIGKKGHTETLYERLQKYKTGRGSQGKNKTEGSF